MIHRSTLSPYQQATTRNKFHFRNIPKCPPVQVYFIKSRNHLYSPEYSNYELLELALEEDACTQLPAFEFKEDKRNEFYLIT